MPEMETLVSLASWMVVAARAGEALNLHGSARVEDVKGF
jgi:hypothetical protein